MAVNGYMVCPPIHGSLFILEIGEPVNGGWTDWGNWTTCSPTCDNGTESRSRSCTNPAPRYGGEDCDGDAVETRACEVPECPGMFYNIPESCCFGWPDETESSQNVSHS